MTINQERNGDILKVIPKGRLDSASSGEFTEFIETNFTEDVKKLVIDFGGVDFISSNGLRVIVTIYKNLGGRTIEITNANTAVMEIFRLSGFLKAIEIK